MRKLIVLLFLLITSYPVVGQTPPYIHFRGGEDIPSSETYHVIQDRQGYIWIATANGVSRFDGYEFKNFGKKDGLPDNVILEIYEDYKGRIWFVSYSGVLSYYYNGKIYPYKFNYLMSKIFSDGRAAVKLSFRVSKNDKITISVKAKGAYEISANGKLEMLNKDDSTRLTVDFREVTNNGFISFGSKSEHSILLKLPNKILAVTDFPLYVPSHLFAIKDKKNNVVISLSDGVITLFDNKFSYRKTPMPIIWMSIDRSGLVWVSKFSSGLECYRNLNPDQPPILKLFDGLSITSVLEDREGGYWFTTYANGVFYVSNINNRAYFWKPDQFDNGQVQAFCATPRGIWVGFDSRKLYWIPSNGDTVEVSHSFLNQPDISINKIFCDKKHHKLWLLSNVNLYSASNRKFIRYTDIELYDKKYKGILPRCVAFEGNKLWIGTRSGIILFDGHKRIYDSNVCGDFSEYVSSIAVANDGTKWIGCSNGLWKYYGGKYKWLGDTVPVLRSQISELKFNPVDSSLWIATRGNGIVVLSRDVCSIIDRSTGLVSDEVSSLSMGKDRVWVGTSAGINQISIVPDISGKYIVGSFDKSVGIVSNEIIGLEATDSTLIIGTSRGLMVYPLVDPAKQVRPEIYITKFVVNGKDTVVKSGSSFSYLENHITIDFSGLTFKTLRKTLFRYKLHKDDPEFSYTRFPSVTLPALSPNAYNFEVWAQNAYGQWSEQPATIDFVINSPFWDTPWFIFLASTLIIATISTLFAYRFRSLKRQTALSRRLDGWKQQALLQQMNPHFIFNTLNSIQLFILQNDTLSSHRYLTKFAKLMRLTLDNSQNFSVRLSEELETISLYLELEALRADGKFTFEIKQPEDLLLEARIPSLIIQPFIENAIWHGVMPKTSPGVITIQFRQKANSILCTIEDNGIGRKAAESYAATRVHKSLGSKITMQRLQLLKSLHNQQLGILYKDLVDKDGNPSGTRVELTIPILSSKIQLD